MPTRKSFFEWVAKDVSIKTRYDIALSLRADFFAEEIIEIADSSESDTYTDSDGNVRTDHEVVARAKLRVDARKWYASKMNPKKYGDKVENTLLGDKDSPLQIERIERVIVDK
jgi:hypothetical protein